jgi:cytochrome c oxidase cbb3-type subunit 3
MVLAISSVTAAALTPACRREDRRFDELPELTKLTGLSGTSTAAPDFKNPYLQNAWALSEGKRLFDWYNCSGCHAHGGGGIGPPLMDDAWIYGGHALDIVHTIVRGRPNGMPSFAGKIPDYQVWQLAAYVESISGRAPIDAAPGRNDSIAVGKPEAMRP